MSNVFIYVGGCELRGLDANRLRQYLIRNNYTLINNPKNADFIVFIGCAAVGKAGDISLQLVEKFKRYNAELIVGGCLPIIEKERLSKIFDGEKISTKDFNQTPEKIDEIFNGKNINFKSVEDQNLIFENGMAYQPMGAIKLFFSDKKTISNVYFKIRNHIIKYLAGQYSLYYLTSAGSSLYRIRPAWGCPCNCSYCAIKRAVGPLQSKPLDTVLAEFKKGIDNGFNKFVLTTDDVGAYGIDIGRNFGELLEGMINIEGDYTIMLNNLHPVWIVKYIDKLEELVKSKKIIRIESPIQTGSSRILKLMHRYSDTEKMKDAFLRLKRAYTNLGIDTLIMVGFPTETDVDFEQTVSLFKEVNFISGSFFPFSGREGTVAPAIEPKVPKNDINKRMKYAYKSLKKLGYKVNYEHGKKHYGYPFPGSFMFWKKI